MLKIRIKKSQLALWGAMLFSLLNLAIDWPAIFLSFTGEPMADRSVYLYLIETKNNPVYYLNEKNVLVLFSSELSWHYAADFLSEILGSAENCINVISFLVLWRLSYLVIVRAGWVYLIFLVNPLVIEFVYSQIRLAAAISLASILQRRDDFSFRSALVYLLCASVHTAMIIFGFIHFVAAKFSKAQIVDLIVHVTVGVLIALMLSDSFRAVVLGVIGDRRIDYLDMRSSAFYLSYWLFLLPLLLLGWRDSMSVFDSRYSVIVLVLAACSLIFGGYPSRFIAAAYPAILVAMKNYRVRGLAINVPVLAFIPYFVIQWMFWLRVVNISSFA